MEKTNNKNLAHLAANVFLRVPTLDAATHAIQALQEDAKLNGLKIAAVLANVERESLYKENGYKNTEEYAKAELGFNHTHIRNLLNVGLNLLDADGVPQISGGEKWTAGALSEVISNPKAAMKMAEDGVISASMTSKEVRDAFAAHKNDPEYQLTDPNSKTKTSVLRQYDGEVRDGMGAVKFGFTEKTLDEVEQAIFDTCECGAGDNNPIRHAAKMEDGGHLVMMIYPSGRMYAYSYVPHAKAAKTTKTDKAAELARTKMKAAGYSDDEIANILAIMGAANGK